MDLRNEMTQRATNGRSPMAAANEDLEAIPQLFYQAVEQVMHANIAPMLALWSEQDDVTYCDPNGQPHKGRDGLVSLLM
jgi:hypothetical protein